MVGQARRRAGLLQAREVGQRRGLVRQPAGHQLEADDAERVEVGGRAGGLAPRLLGRQVGRGAEHRADLRDVRLLGGLGDAEVGELDHAVGVDEQVAGLDVAVHDAVAMRVVEPAAGLGEHVHGGARRHRPAVAQQLGARVPVDELHDDELARRVAVRAEVEDLHDVRVHEPRGGERLALEARHEARVLGQVLGEQLDRHVALQPGVERELDRGHAADAEAAVEPVAVGEELLGGHPEGGVAVGFVFGRLGGCLGRRGGGGLDRRLGGGLGRRLGGRRRRRSPSARPRSASAPAWPLPPPRPGSPPGSGSGCARSSRAGSA